MEYNNKTASTVWNTTIKTDSTAAAVKTAAAADVKTATAAAAVAVQCGRSGWTEKKQENVNGLYICPLLKNSAVQDNYCIM